MANPVAFSSYSYPNVGDKVVYFGPKVDLGGWFALDGDNLTVVDSYTDSNGNYLYTIQDVNGNIAQNISIDDGTGVLDQVGPDTSSGGSGYLLGDFE